MHNSKKKWDLTIFSWNKVMHIFEDIFYFPQLPAACPICKQRRTVDVCINTMFYDGEINLECNDCGVVFVEENPENYKYTPQKQLEIAKNAY